ncbi:MAG: IS6 family transposase [Nitrospira sp.]|nr:IS6 family transposase [Candidatus Manganitrophaceae bacterium]HIL35729.1 IS6 family transposase [Candidatus Manganitrophaceae bacterium]
MLSFKGCHFEKEIILICTRWYLAYPLSSRHVEEMMEERGVDVDHSTINRWVLKFTPFIEKEFRKKKRPVGQSWRMDETYVSVKGEWKYLYRAVDKEGLTIDFILTAKRDRKAVRRFLNKAIEFQKKPSKINIDKSGANKAGIRIYNQENRKRIKIRQCKYLNNIIEQDHRFIKKKIRPMLGFKSFRSARITLGGIETIHMIHKGQMKQWAGQHQTFVQQFYSLAA